MEPQQNIDLVANTDRITSAMALPSSSSRTIDKPKTTKRRKVAKACLFCKRSHMTCDDSRPCQRCIKRDIGHLCGDDPPPQPSARNTITPSHGPSFPTHPIHTHSQGTLPITHRVDIDPSIATPPPIRLQNPIGPFSNSSSSNPQISASPLLGLINTSQPITPTQPHLDINEILMSYPGLFNNVSGIPSSSDTDPLSITTNEIINSNLVVNNNSFDNDRVNNLVSGFSSSSNEIHIFDYQISEQRLLDWVNQMAFPGTKQKLLRTLSEIQPAISTITSTLTPQNKLESEQTFQSLLNQYTPIFSTLPIPACIWRRTGEIVKTNQQFCELIGMSKQELEIDINNASSITRNSQKCYIYQLWNDDSNLNYWEKYCRIALDEGQKAVLTSCVLLKNNPLNNNNNNNNTTKSTDSNPIVQQQHQTLSCTFSFTIRRDSWSVPSLIVGNFLPC